MMYEIKKEIPVPPKQYKNIRYPIYELQVGECFLFEEEKRQAVANAVCNYKKRHPKKKFTVRKFHEEKNTYGCWRLK